MGLTTRAWRIVRRSAASRRQVGLASLLAATVILAPAQPAAALAPTTTTGTIASPPGGELIARCSGYDVRATYLVTYRATTFYDDTGTPVRIQTHYYGTGSFFNSTDPTKALIGKSPTIDTQWLQRGTSASVGLYLKNTVPGQGLALIDVGRLVWDLDSGELLFEAGPPHARTGASVDWCALVA